MSPDPWSAFLAWLTTVVVPNWSELVGMLPFWVLLGVTGPIVSLIALAWAYHFVTRPRVHLKRAIPEVVNASRDADGLFVFPPNQPYNPQLGLIYPADRTTCEVDGSNLMVRCPVDGTVREAAIQVCRACGTKYVLGAAKTPMLVARTGTPPKGGAAAA
ncbi:MAG: hypothetical protein U0869_11060 [Chloroflexota bacterium]